MPSTQWLSEQAVCVGRAHLDKRPVRMWKTPGLEGRARWHWFDQTTRLPSRSLFLSRAADPAIIGDYAMTYFSAFATLPDTNLKGLRDMCRKKAQRVTVHAAASAPTARESMAIRNKAAKTERQKRIATLIPGLSHQACSRMKPVRWSDRFVMTATITPIRFSENPYQSMIYYDWNDAETQLAVMFQGTPPVLQGLISLKKGVGYRIELKPAGAVCAAVFPGLVRPDWMTVAGCECKGVINYKPAISSAGDTQIISCPIKHQDQRIMWNWYTAEVRPVMLVEAAARGSGVMLADYHDCLPNRTGKPKDFELPNVCNAAANPAHPASGTHTLSNPSCSDCHTTEQ